MKLSYVAIENISALKKTRPRIATLTHGVVQILDWALKVLVKWTGKRLEKLACVISTDSENFISRKVYNKLGIW